MSDNSMKIEIITTEKPGPEPKIKVEVSAIDARSIDNFSLCMHMIDAFAVGAAQTVKGMGGTPESFVQLMSDNVRKYWSFGSGEKEGDKFIHPVQETRN